MKKFTALLLCLLALCQIGAAQDPLVIPDTDEGVPGAGPLRRTEWFRGVWQKRRKSWLDKTEADKGSVVFLGDSITQGWSNDFLGAFGQLKIVNRGISGDTSRGLLLRLKEDVIDVEPRAVVLMVGANDLAEKARADTVSANVKLIIEALKAHNKTMPIVLCETFPCAPDDYRPVAEIRKINALYAETWRDDPQVTIAKTYDLFSGDDGASLPKYFPDRVHPNAEGYWMWAGMLRPIFDKLGLGDTTPIPHAWIHFTRNDKQVASFNEFYIYYTDRDQPLEFTIEVPPDPSHRLAFQWITKLGPMRSMTVEVNGKEKTVRHPSQGNGKQSFFWDTLPVTDFGITEKQANGTYRVKIWCPDDAEEDAVIAGIRLISDDTQLARVKFESPSHKVLFVAPGSVKEADPAATK